MKVIKNVIFLILLVISAILFTNAVFADKNFPEREVTLTLGASPGGGSDMTLRALAKATEPFLGVPIVVVNLKGGVVSLAECAAAPPDGYLLSMLTEQAQNIPMLYGDDITFDEYSFKPVITVNFDPAVVAVRSSSPFDTMESLISYAKDNPGVVTMGNSGFGNIWHLCAVGLQSATGVKFTHVPFFGAAPTLVATLGGHITAMVASPPELAAQARAGEVKMLGIMSDTRDPNWPELKTLKEQGIDFSLGTWRGLGAPKDTPDEIIKILHDAFKKGYETDEFQKFMIERGLGLLYRSSEETREWMEKDKVRFKQIMIDMGLIEE